MSPVDDFERDGLSSPSRYQGWLDVVVERLLSGVLKNIFRLTAVPKKNQRGREVTAPKCIIFIFYLEIRGN
jgi:hypothetical protein